MWRFTVFGILIGLAHLAIADECDSGIAVRAFFTRIELDGTGPRLDESPAGCFAQPHESFPSPEQTFVLAPHKTMQKMNGFGGSLTESCAMNLQRLPKSLRREVLGALFSKSRGAGLDFIRLPMGSSDFANAARGNYTYDDSPGNRPDQHFRHFDMNRDEKSFQIIRLARKLNPDLKVMISPWSAPAWMKKPRTLKGGGLDPHYRQDFADYFVRVIRELEKRGIPVDSLTIQNEPGYPNEDYPSMGMTADEQKIFVRDFLAPTLRREEIPARIFIHDHNFDMFADVNSMLEDAILRESVHGVAYHCYGGDYSMMVETASRFPSVPIFQTECSGVMSSDQQGSFMWWLENHTIDASNVGGTGSIAWNLCLDQNGGPRNGGCEGCRGLVTTDFGAAKAKIVLNGEYYALAHASRFLKSGSQRVGLLSSPGDVHASAFIDTDRQIVFVAANFSDEPRGIRVVRGNEGLDYWLAARSAVTLTWTEP